MAKTVSSKYAVRAASEPMSDFTMMDQEQMHPDPEKEFHSEACMYDGWSGKKRIDTTFENTSRTLVARPRSDKVYPHNPAPNDPKYGSEWDMSQDWRRWPKY